MYKDILPDFKLVIVVVSFLFFNFLHKTIFVQQYSSIVIKNFNYDETYFTNDKVIKSFFLRTLFLIAQALIFIFFFKFNINIIYKGFIIGGFLNIWPAVVYFKLLKIPFTSDKFLILIRYALYVIHIPVTLYFTNDFLVPSFRGEKVLFLGNEGVGLMINLLFLSFPTIIDRLISKTCSLKFNIPVDAFVEEVELSVNNVNINRSFIRERYKYEISKYSKKYDVNHELIEIILSIEYIYRGGNFQQWLEKIYCKFFYDDAIKKDISIGVSQIKISTASKILEISPLRFKKKLFDPDFMIKTTCLYISKILAEYKENKDSDKDIYEYLVEEYNGHSNSHSTKVYTAVLRSFLKNKKLKFNI